MIAKFIGYLKASKQIYTTAPPMVGPDRNPTVRAYWNNPLFRFYDPNTLDYSPEQGYGPRPIPTFPKSTGGTQNYNINCPKQPVTMWDRSPDGKAVMDFFKTQQGQSGLHRV